MWFRDWRRARREAIAFAIVAGSMVLVSVLGIGIEQYQKVTYDKVTAMIVDLRSVPGTDLAFEYQGVEHTYSFGGSIPGKGPGDMVEILVYPGHPDSVQIPEKMGIKPLIVLIPAGFFALVALADYLIMLIGRRREGRRAPY